MTTTARHSYITWPEGTTQPNVGYNDLVDKLDVEVGLSVISRTTDAQPASPTEGDTYLITGSATGAAWSTYSQHDIAIYRSAAWTAITPIKGQVVHIQDESDAILVWNGTAYVAPAGAVEFADNVFRIQDNGDATKEIAFEASGIATGTVRTITMPDADVDLGEVGAVEFADSVFRIQDNTDATKELAFEVSGITTATTRTITVPDEDITLGGIIDEDDMASDSPTRVPSQQSVKAYVDAEVAGVAGFDGTKYVGVNDQTGTTYTLVLADAGKLITMNNAAANTLTIPANASVAFPVGTRIDVVQIGAGQTTVAITTDTLNAAGGTKINAQYEIVSLIKIASTTWILAGGVA